MSSHDPSTPRVPPVQPSPAARPTLNPGLGRSAPKIQDHHRARLAIVYVRQSSPHQVLEHRESRERQYALVHQAVALGWPQDRVLVFDEDQGQSSKRADSRAGFQRLVAEVTMNHVGLVLGLDMSRLARADMDWHRLFELSAFSQTLLGDEDGVYDANDPNDRLLLGLKGMLSEAELFTMRNRLERGKLNKAERGELFVNVPMGYVKLPSGQLDRDPDEQVQAIVRLLFDKFDELGTVWGVFRYLLRYNLRLGFRVQRGGRRGQLEWRQPALPSLYGIFRNPIYAGAYAYGRRRLDRRRPGKAKARWVAMAEWTVLIRDRLPAYITWERYVANQERKQQNRSSATSVGVARRGVALLTGLLVCGRCGRRLQASYRVTGKAYYSCDRHLEAGTAPRCTGLAASVVDDLVAAEVLHALEPAALELSLQAVEDVEKERQRLDRQWRHQLERARYEVERAERQYQAVEPENRLVARTLEKHWEETLQHAASIQEDYDRFLQERPQALSTEARRRIQALAEDLPGLWHATTTTAADRKEMIRCLVERVVVQVRKDSEHVPVTIHWQGGFRSEHHVVRPVRRYTQLEGLEQLLDRIAQWRREGHSAAAIAAKLNEAGYRTPKRRREFTGEMVRQLLSRRGLANEKRLVDQLGPGEWWLSELAEELGLSTLKLRDWVVQGWLHGRQTPAQGLWIVWADRDELKRLRKLKARSKRGAKYYPAALTTPKQRTKSNSSISSKD
jgi:DNA invertase Pin-like site-specific DNA recombinase